MPSDHADDMEKDHNYSGDNLEDEEPLNTSSSRSFHRQVVTIPIYIDVC